MTEEIVMEREDQRFSVPRGPLNRGRLEFARGAARLTVRGAGIPELVRARFDGPTPQVLVDGGAVTVRYPRFSFRDWLRPWVRRGGQVTLNNNLSWDLSIHGGVAHLDADLRDLQLEALEVRRGASRVEVRLPRPSGVGASADRWRRQPRAHPPAGGDPGAAAHRPGRCRPDLRQPGVRGGRWPAAAGEPQAGIAEGSYEIEIAGGAASVQITTE